VSPSEEAAWEAARAFGSCVESTLGDQFVSAYVVGSLIHGGFRAGTTPVDVILVLAGDSPALDAEREVHRAARRVTEPSRIRCVLLSERDLAPPYVPERGTAPEVLRLDDEGSRVAGMDLRARLVRPTKKDMLLHARSYARLIEETLLRTDADETPTAFEVFELTATACRHHVFARENLLIWRETDAMMAFCMDPGAHPAAVPFVRDIATRGPSLDHVSAAQHQNLISFWRAVHEEITT